MAKSPGTATPEELQLQHDSLSQKLEQLEREKSHFNISNLSRVATSFPPEDWSTLYSASSGVGDIHRRIQREAEIEAEIAGLKKMKGLISQKLSDTRVTARLERLNKEQANLSAGMNFASDVLLQEFASRRIQAVTWSLVLLVTGVVVASIAYQAQDIVAFLTVTLAVPTAITAEFVPLLRLRRLMATTAQLAPLIQRGVAQ